MQKSTTPDDMTAVISSGPLPNLPNPSSISTSMSSSTTASGTSPASPNPSGTIATSGGLTGSGAGVNKRYRPAPAKTFQCRGYGECRMVFSRSEHLARHIRKHTGERPFSCHCSKQFSRLDNLRQHAQTVHADKQEQNERMMRELTSLHANMAAATKATIGISRNPSRSNPRSAASSSQVNDDDDNDGALNLIKQEDLPSLSMHPRPGSYEEGMSWDSSQNQTHSTSASNPRGSAQHSFRDYHHQQPQPQPAAHSGQSFLAPLQQQQQSQSFLGFSSHNSSSSAQQATSASRPGTSSGAPSLPPLAAVVSASLSRDHQHLNIASHSDQSFHSSASSSSTAAASGGDYSHTYSSGGGSGIPFPPSSSARPSTAGIFAALGGSSRPGTAPALFSTSAARGFFRGMGSTRADRELPLLHSGFTPTARLSSSRPTSSAGPPPPPPPPPAAAYSRSGEYVPPRSSGGYPEWDRERGREYDIQRDKDYVSQRPHTSAGYDASPFYFSPPELPSPSTYNPRKRPFDHDDGPSERDQVFERTRPGTTGSAFGPRSVRPSTSNNYDYGSESRPQSRRLSVMELCNDEPDTRPTSSAGDRFAPGSASFLLSAAAAARPTTAPTGYSSRPTTSSGLVNSAKALRLFDPDSESRDGGHGSTFAFTPPSLPPSSLTALSSAASASILARTGSSTSSAAGVRSLGDERQSSPVTPSTTGPTSPRDYSASPPTQFRFAYGVGGRVDNDDDDDRQSESPRFGFRVSGGRVNDTYTTSSFSSVATSSADVQTTAASFAARTWGSTSTTTGASLYDDSTTGGAAAAANSPISVSPSLSPVPRSVGFVSGRSSSPAISSPLATTTTAATSGVRRIPSDATSYEYSRGYGTDEGRYSNERGSAERSPIPHSAVGYGMRV